MSTQNELAYSWADWSVRFCLPLLLDHIGEVTLAERARRLDPVIDQSTAAAAFATVQVIGDEVRARVDDVAVSSATLVALLTVAELQEVDDDAGWLLSRARYDANRLAEHCRTAGLRNRAVDETFLAQPDIPAVSD